MTAESEHVLRAIWRLLDCLWVSHPDALKIAESKPYQLITAARLGFTIPHTLVTNQSGAALEFASLRDRTIYKPIKHGQIIRENSTGLVYTNLLEEKHFSSLGTVNYSPSMFQAYIEKKSEIRATVVGNEVFAVELYFPLNESCDW